MLDQMRNILDEVLLDTDRLKDYNNLIYGQVDNIANIKEAGAFYSLCYAIDRSIKESNERINQVYKLIWELKKNNGGSADVR